MWPLGSWPWVDGRAGRIASAPRWRKAPTASARDRRRPRRSPRRAGVVRSHGAGVVSGGVPSPHSDARAPTVEAVIDVVVGVAGRAVLVSGFGSWWGLLVGWGTPRPNGVKGAKGAMSPWCPDYIYIAGSSATNVVRAHLVLDAHKWTNDRFRPPRINPRPHRPAPLTQKVTGVDETGRPRRDRRRARAGADLRTSTRRRSSR